MAEQNELKAVEPLIFEQHARHGSRNFTPENESGPELPEEFLRGEEPALPSLCPSCAVSPVQLS